MAKKAKRSRYLDPDHPALASIPLDDKTPPPEDSPTWKLWLACADIADQALATDYMQGIKKGTLDPHQFGQYTLQDAVYCYHAQEDYQTVVDRAVAAGEHDLAAFAEARYQSYGRYNSETFADWHIADPKAVALGKAAQAYVDFEHGIAESARPIYSVISMIPCNQLWAWLATQLEGAVGPSNLYSFWITEDDDWGGTYRLDNFVDAWLAGHPDAYDPEQALFVFRSCMVGELNFFRSACGQSLVPMPEDPALSPTTG